MRELIGRVAVQDDTAASALRVISHFDELAARRASSPVLLRAAAVLAAAPVGMHDGASGRTVRIDPPGPSSSPPELDPKWPRKTFDDVRSASIWIERSGPNGPLDDLILERCAYALIMLLQDTPLAQDELVRVVCDPAASPSERIAAGNALHLTAPLVVVGTRDTGLGVSASLGDLWVSLVEPGALALLPGAASDGCFGLSRITDGDAPAALDRARLALRLATHSACGGEPVIDADHLGAVGDLAKVVSVDAARLSHDVQRLEAIRTERAWAPAVLAQFAAGESLRAAASVLHLHHSTLQDRVRWFEAALGWPIRTPSGRSRASAAWLMWRLSAHLQHHR